MHSLRSPLLLFLLPFLTLMPTKRPNRCNFAHGNLDKEFINESLLDVVFLEQIVLAMQLQYFGIDEVETKKIINEVFCHNLIV